MRRFDLRPGVRRLLRLPLRGRPAIHDDVDAELDALFAARVEAFIAQGMTPAQARDEAARRLGGRVQDVRHALHQSAERRERRMRMSDLSHEFAYDLRHAARALARRPGFTAVAVATLAIGIGAVTAIFSAVDALLLRPLPYAAPGELMSVSLTTPPRGTQPGRDDMVWSYPKFLVFRNAQQVFSELSLYSGQPFTVTSGDLERLGGEFVGATYLRTLGLAPARGRDFDRAVDAHPGAPKQVILSHSLWERRYNADPGVIGRTLDLDREPFTIVGVAPLGFRGLTGQADVFVPVTTRQASGDLDQPLSHEFYLIARRKPGTSAEAAMSAVAALGQRVDEAFGAAMGADGGWGAVARPLDAIRVAPTVRRALVVLAGAVAFVLLIACVNVANLLLGRAAARQHELAVRVALGAGRARLARMLLAEHLLLAFAGGAASLAVAWAGVRALRAIDPAAALRVPRAGGIDTVTFSLVSLNWTALAFAVGVTLVVGLSFSLIPAAGTTHDVVSRKLKSGGDRWATAMVGRRALVVAEVALAMVLLAGSGLMLRSLAGLLSVDPGFDSRGVLTVRLTIPPGGLARDSMPGFYDELLRRLAALPGVQAAALGNCPPLNGGCNATPMVFLDRPGSTLANGPTVGVHWTSPQWFSALRVPLRRGRLYSSADRLGAQKVVVINETAARRFWPNGDALGKRIALGQGGFDDGAEVIGIVGDVRQFVDSAATPDVYVPYLQSPRAGMMIFIRAAGDPGTLAAAVRRTLHEVAPRYPAYDMKPMTARAAGATAQTRFSTTILGIFAATALLLAAVGIYGVMSLVVAARTREIGIRMALGADQRQVRRRVVGEGLALVSIGAGLGLAGALACTRVLRTLLFELEPTDPLTYGVIVAVVLAAALAASWMPARRAARVDPAIALRAE